MWNNRENPGGREPARKTDKDLWKVFGLFFVFAVIGAVLALTWGVIPIGSLGWTLGGMTLLGVVLGAFFFYMHRERMRH